MEETRIEVPVEILEEIYTTLSEGAEPMVPFSADPGEMLTRAYDLRGYAINVARARLVGIIPYMSGTDASEV